jgi:branched-chain amino acid transport system permease protein
MNWFPRKINLKYILFFAALLIPLVVRAPFVLHIIILLGIYVILTDALNFVTGFAGQLALGISAFVTIGGYTGALLMLNNNWSFWMAFLAGGVVGFLSGLILGMLSLRLRGDYLGMVTLGFSEIIRILAINLVGVTRGPMGLPGIPRPQFFGHVFKGDIPYYFLVLGLIVFTHVTIERMLFSRFGRACLAIRDDESAAAAMGVEPYQYKVLAFCISSAYAGLAGVFYASWTTLFSPDSFQLVDSIMISVMNTLGGIGSLLGTFPGAIFIGSLPEIFRPFTTGAGVASLRLALVGLIMVVFLIVRPQGIAGMSIDPIYISLEPIRRLFFRNEGKTKENKDEIQ